MDIVDGKIYLGKLDAVYLAQEFGTPLFVIEEDMLQRQYRSIMQGILYRPLYVYYACKANWNIHIMKVLREEGTYIDACSPGDIHLALTAGYTTDEILYTGYAVSDDELRFIIDLDIALNVDSLSQLERYIRLGGRRNIGLRVNTVVSAGFHSHVTSATTTSKFGLHFCQLAEARDIAAASGLKIVGLHTHLGSDILQIEPFLKALDELLLAADQFTDLQYVDLGGGIGVPFSPDERPFDLSIYGHLVSQTLNSWCQRHNRSLALYLEPGEYLVAESTFLLTRVIDIKPATNCDTAKTPTFVGTDTSFNHIFATAIYDAYHKIMVADRGSASGTQYVDICGNLMQAGDILAKKRLMPTLHEGDLLVVETCGAYAMCRASRFNARPLPAEVMVNNGQARLVRQRETVHDLLTHQVLG